MSLRYLSLGVALLAAACAPASGPAPLHAEYDEDTGRLTLLSLDTTGSGSADAWTYMDGARVLRIERDTTGDGAIDRWEYYEGEPGSQRLVKVGFSRGRDGIEDAWAFEGPGGSVARIDISLKRGGVVDRVEHYEAGVLVRAEEDTRRDGRIDKWETYRDGRIAAVAFDGSGRGVPDRVLRYGSGGTLERVETIEDGQE